MIETFQREVEQKTMYRMGEGKKILRRHHRGISLGCRSLLLMQSIDHRQTWRVLKVDGHVRLADRQNNKKNYISSSDVVLFFNCCRLLGERSNYAATEFV